MLLVSFFEMFLWAVASFLLCWTKRISWQAGSSKFHWKYFQSNSLATLYVIYTVGLNLKFYVMNKPAQHECYCIPGSWIFDTYVCKFHKILISLMGLYPSILLIESCVSNNTTVELDIIWDAGQVGRCIIILTCYPLTLLALYSL